MALREFGKHIRRLPQKQLIRELLHLYKQYPEVREYYDQLLDPETEKLLLAKYKRIIRDEFFPKKGFGNLRYSVATNAVRQFMKLRVSEQSIADLLLSYAENGVEFTCEYGDIDERFYITIEKKYEDALEYMKQHKLLSAFQQRTEKIVHDAQDTGWDFYDGLSYTYDQYYGKADA